MVILLLSSIKPFFPLKEGMITSQIELPNSLSWACDTKSSVFVLKTEAFHLQFVYPAVNSSIALPSFTSYLLHCVFALFGCPAAMVFPPSLWSFIYNAR